MKKYLGFILVIVLVISVLVSCASNDTKPLLKVGTNAYFPPYEYYSGGSLVGIDVDIAKEIARRNNWDIKFVDMPFNNLFDAAMTGSVDIIASAYTKTDERAQQLDFTSVYATTTQLLLVSSNTTYNNIADVKQSDGLIGALKGSTSEDLAFKEFDIERVRLYESTALLMNALQKGLVESVIVDSDPASWWSKSEDLILLEFTDLVENYAIAISPKCLYGDKIKSTLDSMLQDGTVDDIINQYK